jgi:hypothetical protein
MKIVIEHPQPSAAQRKHAMKRLKAGMLQGAFHNATIPPNHYILSHGSLTARNDYAQPKKDEKS